MRINKFLSNQGLGSRRAIDKAVADGLVLVNGKAAELGQQLCQGDQIKYQNKEIVYSDEQVNKSNENLIYLALNKPAGIECTCDRSNPDNIIDFLINDGAEQGASNSFNRELLNSTKRVYPVGRLDKDSRGLIILTNDGEFANQLMHPKYEHEKEYLVTLEKKINDRFIQKIQNGVEISFSKNKANSSTKTSPCKAQRTSNNKFSITLKEGMNRQIRRMCFSLGNEVIDLLRIRVNKLKLGDLPEGIYVKIEKSQII